MNIDEILVAMGVSGKACGIQKIQTEHRLKLIDFWKIPEGASVLEVGCGQGDTTAALAYVVGDKGFVHGIDIADEDYGSPFTLGQAREKLLASSLGQRIQMDFRTDLLTDASTLKEEYDYAVLSQCSWYFESEEQLVQLLTVLRKYAKRLCFAEWDIQATLPEQIPHFYAAQIQAICASFMTDNTSNIRNLFTPHDLKRIAEKSGWNVWEEIRIHSPEMQDGKWEVDMAVDLYPEVIRSNPHMPDGLKRMLLSELDLITGLDAGKIKPLGVYAFCAR